MGHSMEWLSEQSGQAAHQLKVCAGRAACACVRKRISMLASSRWMCGVAVRCSSFATLSNMCTQGTERAGALQEGGTDGGGEWG